MSLLNWLLPRRQPSSRKPSRRGRPGLEALEERWTPSTFTVTNTYDDGGQGTLRWAVNQANQHPGDDTITFNLNQSSWGVSLPFPSTITLNHANGPLTLTDTTGQTFINGPAAGLLTVDGNGGTRVFQVNPHVTASLTGLTVTDGFAPSSAGGIRNDGTLTLTNCTVSRNSTGNGYGGGVYNDGSLTLNNSTVYRNSAYMGGGIYSNGSLTVTGCTFTLNSAGWDGGGILNEGNLQLNSTTFDQNSAYWFGGAIFSDSVLTDTGSTFSRGSATYGGGIANGGVATLTGSTVSGNSASQGGGGIYNYANLTLDSGYVLGNSATLGGGICNDGSAGLTGICVQFNSATSEGGGIYNNGGLWLDHSAVCSNKIVNGHGNEGGGLFLAAGSSYDPFLSQVNGNYGIYQVGPNTFMQVADEIASS